MTHNAFRLSIEELAYALGVAASVFLLCLLGERPQREMQGRLLAAAHGLAARELLDFDEDAGIRGLSPALAAAVAPLLQHSRAIRCSRVAGGHEAVLSFFFGSDGVSAQRLQRSIVAHLERLDGPVAALERAVAFFDLPADNGKDAALGTAAASLLEQARYANDAAQRESYAAQFAAGGLPAGTAVALANDLSHPAVRGSVLRIMVDGDRPAANAGFLVLHAAARAWLFEPEQPDAEVVRVVPGHAAALRRMLADLMSV
jgi:hypothetical protein